MHSVRIATGTSIGAARAGGWLMAEAAGEPCTKLWQAMAPAAIRWDVMFSGEALKQLLCAALFGPLVNTVLNFLLTLYGATYYGATYHGATYYGCICIH